MPNFIEMKAHLLGFACLILWGIATPTQEAHHHKTTEHHNTFHKHHHSDDKTSTGEPGALKNIILHKVLPQQNKPNQKSQVNAPILSNAKGILGKQHAPKTAVSVQATGRAILVQNANNGVGHVVQAGSASGKAPVIVINSDASGNKAGSLDPFSQDCLDAHNNYRAKHGVPPLMWSNDLAEGAQAWADQLASTDSLQHDQVAIQNRKMGENLAYFQPAVPKCEGAMVDNCVNCREMIQRWYDEIKNYDFDKGGPKTRSGPYKHFSQLIWANTAELGVGTAVSKRYGFITVARYRPTGNDGDFAEFIKNVPPEGGPLPTMTPPLKDNTIPSGEVKNPSIAPDSSTNLIVSSAAATFSKGETVTPSKITKQDSSTSTTIQGAKPPVTIAAKNTASVAPVAPQKDGTKLATVTPLKTTKQNASTSISTQGAKQPVAVPQKNTASVTPIAPQKNGTKLANPSTPKQPIAINKEAHPKGGFVHTMTANDGTKAQVYLSRNGAHAGIVFRNEISRVQPEEETTGVKRTIYVL